MTETEPPGAIICSDTRITADGRKIIPWFCSKLEPIGKNLAVCYTSSNAAATILALKTVGQYSNVKRVGNSLRDAHERYGGITELIAVVSRRDQAPQLLELMPPQYSPRPLQGIVGIGDRDVLRWFGDNFVEDPIAELLAQRPSPQALEGLARSVGHPVQFPPLTYPVGQAALTVSAAFAEGIRIAGGPAVSLPVQVVTISRGEARAMQITATADLENFEDITVERELLRIPRPDPPQAKRDTVPRSAVQLFS